MNLLSVLLGASVILSACQPGGIGPTVTRANGVPDQVGVGVRASFVVASIAGLLGLAADGRSLGRIVDLPPQTTPSAPTLHPSGSAIAFALSQLTGTAGFGSDIYSVNRDGSGLRPLVTHERENVFYASPVFDPSGNVLYVHRRAAVAPGGQLAGGVYGGVEDSIERLDLQTGERRRIIGDAAEPALSPDGRTLVFVHLDRGQPSGVWAASADGSGARSLFKTPTSFYWLQGTRFAPSGREVVFCAAGRVQARGTGGVKLAHLEQPSELIVAPLDGSGMRVIAKTGDDVVPAWSPDGARIAYVLTGSLYVVSAADGTVSSRADGLASFYGDPLWLPPQ